LPTKKEEKAVLYDFFLPVQFFLLTLWMVPSGEGKGRMVDLISQEYDIVARYQGGNNAGHTVKNERGKFVLNLLTMRPLPSSPQLIPVIAVSIINDLFIVFQKTAFSVHLARDTPGGNNAGHTVKNERGKFVLNLLPSGILRPDVVCVMGNS